MPQQRGCTRVARHLGEHPQGDLRPKQHQATFTALHKGGGVFKCVFKIEQNSFAFLGEHWLFCLTLPKPTKQKKNYFFFFPWGIQYSSVHTGFLVPACLCLLFCETSLSVSIVEKPTGLYPFRDVCSQLNCKVIPVSKSNSKKRYIPGLGSEPKRSPYTLRSRENIQVWEFGILISL